MVALFVFAALFIIFFVIVLCFSFSSTHSSMFTAIPGKITVWFVLSSLLGFTLVNDILKIENPIWLTVTCMVIAAAVTSVIRRLVLPNVSILRDMVPALAGVILFVTTRFVMHEIGKNIVDQFEVFLD